MFDSKITVDTQPVVTQLNLARWALENVAEDNHHALKQFAESFAQLDSEITENMDKRQKMLATLDKLGLPSSLFLQLYPGSEPSDKALPDAFRVFCTQTEQDIQVAEEIIESANALHAKAKAADNPYVCSMFILVPWMYKFDGAKKLIKQCTEFEHLHSELMGLLRSRAALVSQANQINTQVDEVQELASKLTKIDISDPHEKVRKFLCSGSDSVSE